MSDYEASHNADEMIGLREEVERLRTANETALDLLQLLAREHEQESIRLGEQWSADPWLWGQACGESRAHGAIAVQLGALANGLMMRFHPELRERHEEGSTQAIAEADRGFVLHKSRAVTEAQLTNMAAARSLPYALGERFTERSGVFVVVGAGPSLEQTGPELARLQAEGVVICTVNAALGAVSRYCVPDVVMTREVVDVSDHLRHPAGLYVMDLSAAPRAWDVARHMGDVAWFVPGASQCFNLAQAYGVRPLFGGTAAATAMVALCEEWGASSIVLVAMDFSTSAANGSPWEGYAVDDDGRVSGAGYEAKKAAHASAGLPPPDAVMGVAMAHGWGGGVVRTLTQYADQVSWLEDFARRRPDIHCIDATGAGVRKRGWFELWLNETETFGCHGRPSWRPTDCVPLTDAQHDAAREHVLAQSRTAQAVAQNVLHEQGVPSVVPRFVRGWDVIDALAGAEMLRAVEAPGTRGERITRMYRAIEEASERARAIIGT